MKKAKNNIKINKLVLIIAFFCFIILIFRTSYLALATKIDGINIEKFALNRTTTKKTIYAGRGTIYDTNGDVLAENVSSYTLIAYLDESRSKGYNNPQHVVDKEYTAQQLATVLDMTEEKILSYLNQKDLYQVEFGAKGKYLTELTKEKIEVLNLPGIDFIESIQRYYPNGEFLSYALGYAKKNDEGIMTGELGIEQLYNEELSGTDGYIEYQKDANGYQIPNTKEIRKDAITGNDIYLSIDSNIQFFVEQALNESFDNYDMEWITMVVADAKTGAILAESSKPSFNPNVLNIENYYDLNVSLPFEPGSTMKLYTYMAAMEKGTYDGNATLKSGNYKVDDQTTIYDWNRKGWGTITYDQGLSLSSNVAIINILNNFIDADDLKEYFALMGFGQKTKVGLANESAGIVKFKYLSEIYNAGFGQGVTTTPMQHIKALTAIANDGILLQPYIVAKVVDSDTGEVIVANKKTELGRVASKETAVKVRELMHNVVYLSGYRTGAIYGVDGYDVIAKTGTSQLYNTLAGKYYYDDYNVIRSVSLMLPKDDPEIIIYIAAKRVKAASSVPLSKATSKVIKSIATYLNINSDKDEKTENYNVKSFINSYTDNAIIELEKNNVSYVVIGDGDKIINQYPSKGNVLNSNEKMFLLTNNNNYEMPSLIGYSSKEVIAVANLLNINYELNGYGYVYSQEPKKNTLISDDTVIKANLKILYTEKDEE